VCPINSPEEVLKKALDGEMAFAVEFHGPPVVVLVPCELLVAQCLSKALADIPSDCAVSTAVVIFIGHLSLR
jgi:hypothetical protein